MSMPQGGESRLPGETGPQAGASADQRSAGVPGQAGAPSQEGTSGQQWAGGPQGQYPYGAPPQGGMPAQPAGQPMQGRPISPVNEIETRVTGRRVGQYIIDYIITAVVASFIMWVFDRSTGGANAILLLIGAVLSAAWYFWYWVLRPYRANGQSFGMQLLGLRIISLNGGRASMVQLFIRGILLIVDTLIWGLVGFITIICSRYRQRIGDHAAKTLVVRARMQAMTSPREYAGAGQAGYR
jgi:uncharacterized RDD family membrane protein YckC